MCSGRGPWSVDLYGRTVPNIQVATFGGWVERLPSWDQHCCGRGALSDVGSLWKALDEQLLPLLRRYRHNLASLQVDRKEDNTLLSEADIATQTAIIQTIQRHFPGSRFVAEEDEAELSSSRN